MQPTRESYTSRCWEILAFTYLLAILLLPSFCFAAPTEVTIFPQAARVTEATKVRFLPGGKDLRKAVIALPAQADPDSFIAYPPPEARLKIEDLIWHQVARDKDVKIKDLRKRIKLLKDEKNGLEAALQSLDAQIQFWQQQIKAKAKPSEAGVVAVAIGKNIKKAYQEKLNLTQEIPGLDRKIKELEEELKLSNAGNQNIWEATILFSGASAGETMLTYSYTLTGCGWLPLYRLDARPQAGEIRFSWEAEVWQNSGENWNDVNVALATGRPPTSFTPADIAPWIIKPRPETKTKGKRSADTVKAAYQTSLAGASSTDEEAAPPVPQGAFILLNAGRKAIPSEARHKIKIREEVWSADFSYLARPGQSPQAFISAFFRFSETKEIPAGTAFLSHNGAILGKRNFVLSGQEGTLFFGQDPLVTVTSHLLSNQDGSASVKEKKSYHRQWRFDAHNSRPFPVRLRIEEPIPSSVDERIKVTLTHAPPPSEQKPELLIWEIELTAGEKKSIQFGINIEAPANLEIIF
jgi:uncharacterized protein (TIGR02231 family)